MARPPTDPDLTDGDDFGRRRRPVPNRRSESDGGPSSPRDGLPATGRAGPFSAQRLGEALRTAAWLGPLTVGIWIYAEREQNVFPKGFNSAGVAVQVSTTTADRFVELAYATPGQATTVNLKLSGPQNGVQVVQQDLAARGLNLDLGTRWAVGANQPLNVVETIRDNPLFRQNGVTVDEADPKDLAVNVERVVSVEAVVRLSPRVPADSVTATFDPPRVTLRGPASQLAELAQLERSADGQPFVYAVPSEPLDRLGPGDHTLADVSIELPDPERAVRIRPGTVTAKLQLRAADQTVDLDRVTVAGVATQATWNQFKLTINDGDPTLAHVHVVGPESKVADLLKGRARPVTAEVDVDQNDESRPDGDKVVRFVLPEGLHVSPEDANRTVHVRLDRRDSGGL